MAAKGLDRASDAVCYALFYRSAGGCAQDCFCGRLCLFSQSILKKTNCEDVVRAVPAVRLLLESDGPYQALERNRESEPAFLPCLAEKPAAARGENLEEFVSQTYQNALGFINVCN
ncbi:MAG: TatD family hydrolase [Alphaproteobacteria bacterium]